MFYTFICQEILGKSNERQRSEENRTQKRLTRFRLESKPGEERNLVIFTDTPIFKDINGELSTRRFY